jgi:hypothetical protein
MTVKELKKELEQYDEDMEVFQRMQGQEMTVVTEIRMCKPNKQIKVYDTPYSGTKTLEIGDKALLIEYCYYYRRICSEIKYNIGHETYIIKYALNIKDNSYEFDSILDSDRYKIYPSHYTITNDIKILLEYAKPSLKEIIDNIVDKEGYHKRLQSYGLAE